MKKSEKRIRGKDEIFEQGVVFEASEEELMHALKELSTGYVPNEMVRHREIIRAVTINTLLSQWHIDKIESRNSKLTGIIIVLTVVSIILSILTFLYK